MTAASTQPPADHWRRERRLLIVAAAALVCLLLAAGVAVGSRFERDGARLYVEDLHALVAVAAQQLEEVLASVERAVAVTAHSGLTRQAPAPALEQHLERLLSSLHDSGVVAIFALRGEEVVFSGQADLRERAQELLSTSARCQGFSGDACLAFVTDRDGARLAVVSIWELGDWEDQDVQIAAVIAWERVSRELVERTSLDRWSKAFVLDRDGTLLAWPTEAKKPGFNVVDQEAGCAACHRDTGQEPTTARGRWSATTLEIKERPYVIATQEVPIGDAHVTVGMVAPRSAALARLGPVTSWALGLLLALVATVGFVVYRLHRLGSSQVRAIRAANDSAQRVADELEDKVRERTEELRVAHTRAQGLQRQYASLDRLVAVGELAAAFAHEVRTPLNSLSIAGQRLARIARRGDEIEPERALELLDSQARDVEVINSYVENYLQFTRKARAEVGGELSPCDIGALVQEVFGYVEPEARRCGVALNAQIEPSGLKLTVDLGKLRHVLVNLVLNAVQAQPGGGEVVVVAQRDEQGLVLTVRDRGPGIPEERVEEIFEPFRSFREGGTGLGLAICQRLAREEEAVIQLEPGLEGGAVFAVHWPA